MSRTQRPHRDLSGDRFGSLVVLRRLENCAHGRLRWECKCDCGAIVVRKTTGLNNGISTSCGCARRLRVGQREEMGVEALQRLISYDPATGILTWKNCPWSHAFNGREVGAVGSGGYRYLKVFGKLCLAHRIAWAIAYGEFPDGMIDHKDGNRLNNRLDNLRLATPGQNTFNSKVPSHNKSGFKGVCWIKKSSKWKAAIGFQGKQHTVGLFNTKEEAAAAYAAKAIELYGEFTPAHTASPAAMVAAHLRGRR